VVKPPAPISATILAVREAALAASSRNETTNLVVALAAALSAVLLVEFDGVIHLHEGWHDVTRSLNEASGTSSSDGSLDVLVRALAATTTLVVLLWWLSLASRLVALQLALRAWAHVWLLALPVALGLLAHRSADRLRSNAASTAVSWRANSLALRAVLGLAHLLRAAHVTLWLIAVDLAASASSLLTLNLALWTLAHRVALGRASRVIALPTALRVAISLSLSSHFSSHSHGHQQGQHNKS